MGTFLKPLCVALAGVALAASVACSRGATPSAPVASPVPSLEATVAASPTHRRPEETATAAAAYSTPTPSPTQAATSTATATPRPSPTRTATPPPPPTATPPPPTPTPPPTLMPTPRSTPRPTPAPLPDLRPHNQFGVGRPILLMGEDGSLIRGSPYQPGRRVSVSVINAGNAVAYGVTYKLLIDGVEVGKRWVDSGLLPGQTASARLDLDTAVLKYKVRPGLREFKLVAETPMTELSKGNNSYSAWIELVAFRQPTPRRAPQSDLEELIQKAVPTAVDKIKWYTDRDSPELMSMAQELLKDADAPIPWGRTRLAILPFDVYNHMHAQRFAKNAEERAQILEELRRNPLSGYGFSISGPPPLIKIGPARSISIEIDFATGSGFQYVFLKEGILPQTLPTLIRELGGVNHRVVNSPGYAKMLNVDPKEGCRELSLDIFEAYVQQLLIERYGWAGLTNISHLSSPPGLPTARLPPTNLSGHSCLWAMAAEGGYPHGNAPSQFWLNKYFELVRMEDPTPRILEIGSKVKQLDLPYGKNLAQLRLSDKEPTPLSAGLKKKFDPFNQYPELTFDNVIASQPAIYSP